MVSESVLDTNIEFTRFRDWVRWASSAFRRADLFYGHGTDNDLDEAIFLALWAVCQPWSRLEFLWETNLSAAEGEIFKEAVSARIAKRCPAAYITGEAWFCDHPFLVNEHVLVPRSPIAELLAKQFDPWLPQAPERILDLCTGSGCIGIVSALAFEDAVVDLIDVSEPALEVAKKNIARYELGDRVNAIQSDGLDAVMDQRYDLILCNPPYVGDSEYASLPQEYKMEPKLGLTSGKDGFDFVRTLLQNAAQCLAPGGMLVVEVGYGWPDFDEKFSHYPLAWVDFENGGCGVFVIYREQLVEAQS